MIPFERRRPTSGRLRFFCIITFFCTRTHRHPCSRVSPPTHPFYTSFPRLSATPCTLPPRFCHLSFQLPLLSHLLAFAPLLPITLPLALLTSAISLSLLSPLLLPQPCSHTPAPDSLPCTNKHLPPNVLARKCTSPHTAAHCLAPPPAHAHRAAPPFLHPRLALPPLVACPAHDYTSHFPPLPRVKSET